MLLVDGMQCRNDNKNKIFTGKPVKMNFHI